MGYENIAVPFRGWSVIREIGHGGFGKVYEICRDRYGTVERAAMKVISVPQDPNEIKSYLKDGYSIETLRKMYDGSRASVLREYQTMARLKDCPNIVRCEDIQVVMDPDGIGSKIYIRMELLTPIRDYEKLQSFDEEEVIKLGRDICNILVRFEKEGIVHCDIKPENIMVSNRGDYKLGDFWNAILMDPARIGTLLYMAPEFYLGKKLGHNADIYSLGLVLYLLLNNWKMPFFPQDDSKINNNSAAAAQEMRMIGTPVPRPVNGSARLTKVVLKALAYDPADRYQSALEFGNEMTVNDKMYPYFYADIHGEDVVGNEAKKRHSYIKIVYASPTMDKGIEKDDFFMGEVYASPRRLSDSGNDRVDANRDNSVANNEKVVERKVSFCMYCGRRTSEEARFCVACGKEKKKLDQGSTLMDCSDCHSGISPLAFYCPYCGKKTYRAIEREQENEQENEQRIVMNVLYGSPSPINVGKKSLLSRIGDLLKRR